MTAPQSEREAADIAEMCAGRDTTAVTACRLGQKVSVAGTVSIDAKRRRTLGAAAWDGFARQTSIVPFAAILGGRAALSWPELGWWRPAAGLAAYALMLGGHSHLIGISPFPTWAQPHG